MSKNSNKSYDHNRGQQDRANSKGGNGQDNYNPPGKGDPTGGFFSSKATNIARDNYDKGWASHRNQKKN
ncbi:hypothetical protein [uncultured Dysgonomonas sp.]|uniref:hypothetical protein n=1 Tax=uncultured Dysgonomonas sp. TaxID=206096 RepID=UPI00262F94AF|nr:hypothetical protein [uncultured Dysgonomonas sp.]